MISYLSGKIRYKTEESVCIDVGGVGYEVFVVPRILSQFQENNSVTLYIYTHVRENVLKCFGFQKLSERAMFLLLLKVNGVGPKAALSILNQCTLQELRSALDRNDLTLFSSVKGLGKKRAQKILVELKSSLGSIEASVASSNETKDVVDALQSLGFTRHQSEEAVLYLIKERKFQTLSVEERLKEALGYFSNERIKMRT